MDVGAVETRLGLLGWTRKRPLARTSLISCTASMESSGSKDNVKLSAERIFWIFCKGN